MTKQIRKIGREKNAHYWQQVRSGVWYFHVTDDDVVMVDTCDGAGWRRVMFVDLAYLMRPDVHSLESAAVNYWAAAIILAVLFVGCADSLGDLFAGFFGG